MTHIVLFHSVLGLRAVENGAADLLRGAGARVFTYPGAGHFYTDAESPGYDERATTLTWQRALAFLDDLGSARADDAS